MEVHHEDPSASGRCERSRPAFFSQSPQEAIKSERSQLVTLVRAINTAENKCRRAAGTYVSLVNLQRAHLLDETVFRSHYPFNYGYTESTVDAMKLLPNSASLALIVSAPGDHYSSPSTMALIPTTSPFSVTRRDLFTQDNP